MSDNHDVTGATRDRGRDLKQKQSLYFPEDMLGEIKQEAARLDRPLSWVMQRAWKIARAEVRRGPEINGVEKGSGR